MQIITEYTEYKDVEVVRVAHIVNGRIAWQSELRYEKVNNGKILKAR